MVWADVQVAAEWTKTGTTCEASRPSFKKQPLVIMQAAKEIRVVHLDEVSCQGQVLDDLAVPEPGRRYSGYSVTWLLVMLRGDCEQSKEQGYTA